LFFFMLLWRLLLLLWDLQWLNGMLRVCRCRALLWRIPLHLPLLGLPFILLL
jgi:hypothetical protein